MSSSTLPQLRPSQSQAESARVLAFYQETAAHWHKVAYDERHEANELKCMIRDLRDKIIFIEQLLEQLSVKMVC